MNVLSLFDGMSCGQIALGRAGIKVDNYYASELDKYAIKVTQANYPDTVQLGDVTGWRAWNLDWASIDLLIGGSPCQGFSFAGKQLAFDDPRSKLFFVYVEILAHIKAVNPNIKFMLENVRMKKEYLEIISNQLGVQPVFINSNLLSAQNRQRYYWANWEIGQPSDKGIRLVDILETDGKTGTLTTVQKDNVICVIQQVARGNNPGGDRALDGKVPSMTANSWQDNNHLKIRDKSKCVLSSGRGSYDRHEWDSVDKDHIRKLTPVECERLQTVPDNYTNHVSNTQRYKMLGNGWTIDVIAHILSKL